MTTTTIDGCTVQPLLDELASTLLLFGSVSTKAIVQEFWQDFSGVVLSVGPSAFGNDVATAKRRLAAMFASKLYLHVGSTVKATWYALAACDMADGSTCDVFAARVFARWIDGPRVPEDDVPSERLMNRVLRKLAATDDGRRLVAGVVLRAKRADTFVNVVESCTDGAMRRRLLQFAARAAVGCGVPDDRAYRRDVLRRVAALYLTPMANSLDRAYACHCFMLLGDAASVVRVLGDLVRNNEDGSCRAAFKVAMDFSELATQAFRAAVLGCLFGDARYCDPGAPAVVQPENNYQREVVMKLSKLLMGEVTLTENTKFLSRRSNVDESVLKNSIAAVSSCICRTAVVIANGFLHSGTAGDTFLSDYLKAGDWNTCQAYSAVVSVGVIFKGHETNAIPLMHRYLHLCVTKINQSENCWFYSEAGSLYALGLIHVNHGGAIMDYILRQLLDAVNDVVIHGCCIGIGLSALGTHRYDIFELLKKYLYQDKFEFGGVVGLAIGMVMLGSNNNEVLKDLLTYAQVTRHEHILRGLAVGISLIMYDQLEEADRLITDLLSNKNAILRCSGVYTIAMAFCGTGSQTAIKKLLHTAYSDISDDVRSIAVKSLGFLLFRTPKRCVEIVDILTKSYNPYIRYGAAMALGIACAGTGLQEATDLLTPLISDSMNFVRQGALIASALIYIQRKENNYSCVNYFRSLYAQIINDYYGDDMVKFGAILAQGIIDGGGRNVTISLESKIGHNHMLSVVGLLLFTQYQHCASLAHCLTLAFTPVRVIELDPQRKKFVSFINNKDTQTKLNTCFNSLCLEIAEQRGWIWYLFNQNIRPNTGEADKTGLDLSHFAFNTLIPKIMQDVKGMKSNWKTGHFLLRSINCDTKYINHANCLQYDDGKIIAGFNDSTLKVWDKNTFECVMTLMGHTGSVLCLQFNDKIIVSGSSDCTVRVWNLTTGILFTTLIHHRDSVLNLKFNNTMMVTCSKDFSLVVWHMLSPSEIKMHRVLNDHRTIVNVVNFDHKYIVSGSGDQLIRVWSSVSCEFVRFLVGHKLGITCLQYKDRLVISASLDKTIRLWDMEYGFCLRIIQDFSELLVCIQFDNRVIVGGTRDGNIRVWNLEEALDPAALESSLTLRTFKVHTDVVYDLQFDMVQLVSCSGDGRVLVWDFNDYRNTGTNLFNGSFTSDSTILDNISSS